MRRRENGDLCLLDIVLLDGQMLMKRRLRGQWKKKSQQWSKGVISNRILHSIDTISQKIQAMSYYSGIPPFLGDPGAADRLTEVCNEKTGKWRPLPDGYCAPRHLDGDQQEAEEAEEQGWTSAVQQGSDIEYESTPTGSDYSNNRKVQEKDQARRRTRGKSVLDTEAEDAEILPVMLSLRRRQGTISLMREPPCLDSRKHKRVRVGRMEVCGT
jgi:hypothetical protein